MNELMEEILREMRSKGISSREMAAVARLNIRTFYYRLGNPEQFRLGEIDKMCRYLGIKLEGRSK